jgi:hypothetical protein
MAIAPMRPGHGMSFDWKALDQLSVSDSHHETMFSHHEKRQTLVSTQSARTDLWSQVAAVRRLFTFFEARGINFAIMV